MIRPSFPAGARAPRRDGNDRLVRRPAADAVVWFAGVDGTPANLTRPCRRLIARLCLSAVFASTWPGLARAEAQAAARHTPQDMALARKLVGVWRLANRTVTFADGTSRPDPRTTAYLIYSDTGMACYIAMDPTRAAWTSEKAPTPEEALASITGLGAYCGTFHVNAAEGSVVHRMEIERIPNLVGRGPQADVQIRRRRPPDPEGGRQRVPAAGRRAAAALGAREGAARPQRKG